MNLKIVKIILDLIVLILTPTLHFVYILYSFTWVDMILLGFIRMDAFICDIIMIFICICQIILIVLIGMERYHD